MTPALDRERAIRIVYDALQGWFPAASITIDHETIIDLSHGWVIDYDVHFPNRDDELVSDRRYFVDKTDGSLYPFGRYPDVRLQETIYVALYHPELALPWPYLWAVVIDDTRHHLVTSAPQTTLCGVVVPAATPCIGVTDFRTGDGGECIGCNMVTPRLGPWCYRCGRHLKRARSHACDSASTHREEV